MPELPDLVHVERVLSSALVGRQITAARTGDPTVLRLMVPGEFAGALVGRRLQAVERRGHFMRFGFDDALALVVNAMLVGKYRLLAPTEERSDKDPVALGFALVFDDGTELRYLDDKRMGKVYVVRQADEGQIPVYGELGVDLLSPAFDRERFLKLARGRRDQVRPFLMDKRALASIGNAYADEILFAARLHPKTFVRSLTDDDRERLFVAIGTVLRGAIEEIERRDAPSDVKVRDFLAVRGRAGKPCPTCGTKLREVRVGDGDACFCPTCQPATRSLFVDWSKIGPAAGPAVGETTAAPPTEGAKARPRRRSRR
ncbi:MAG TPA: DNA-formamidopyrimidine glycosylase family protein [Polyangia bacterium]|jgi:formamidopyrimidine-DNA glycosylase